MVRRNLLSALVCLALAAPALAGVSAFQQGVSPTAEYAGCIDTYVIGSGWAFDSPSDRPKSPTLGGRAFMKFDLAALPKDQPLQLAILRLHCAGVPDPAAQIAVYPVAREWDESATWFQWKYDAKGKVPPADPKGSVTYSTNAWSKPGGDIDQTDYAQKLPDAKGQPAAAPGLVNVAGVRGGPFGHVVELDVTPLVKAWVDGSKPNNGFALWSVKGGMNVTSADWPLPAYRPTLLINDGGEQLMPTPQGPLKLFEPAGPKAELAKIAASQPAAEGQYATVRYGKNASSMYRDGHMAGYAKQDPRFAGNWGWTPRLRIGGTAGDFNHALFYFNLSNLAKDAKVKRARLKFFVDCGNMHLPADAIDKSQLTPTTKPGAPTPEQIAAEQQKSMIARARQRAAALGPYSFGLFQVLGSGDAPGWKEDEFTFAAPQAGGAWAKPEPPKSNLAMYYSGVAASVESQPVAVIDVGAQLVKAAAAAKDQMPETWVEADVTGIVQAWVGGTAPNRGLLLDNRLMGGEMVVFSDDWIEPDRRPYLEVEVSPGPTAVLDAELKEEPLLPPKDHWVETAKKAHARWKGQKGTFGQYGDSITITMAFWSPLSEKGYANLTPESQAALETANQVIFKDSWRKWKGGEWGNTGNMTIDWAFRNADAWQKKMNPEVAVILFGTNDASYGPAPPIYTEKYAVVVDRILADGGIPIVTTLPPRGSQVGSVAGHIQILDFRQAAIAVAKAKKVPLIDLYTELVRRQPEKWPTLLVPDGLHPSFPKDHQKSFSEESLSQSGYTLRNYLTLMTWYDIYQKVLK